MDNSNRREFLYGLGASLGAVALTDLLAQDGELMILLGRLPQSHRCIRLVPKL